MGPRPLLLMVVVLFFALLVLLDVVEPIEMLVTLVVLLEQRQARGFATKERKGVLAAKVRLGPAASAVSSRSSRDCCS